MEDIVKPTLIGKVYDDKIVTEDEIALAMSGKKEQLKREWGPISILAFATTNLSTWEGSASLLGPAFINGGPVAVIYGFIASFFFILCIYGSMAEMASICPIAGAQYYWVARFVPHRMRGIMSYVQGWITTFAWQCIIITIGYLIASQILALIIFTIPTYEYHGWHCYLMIVLISCMNCTINIWGTRWLPLFETAAGLFHVIFLFAIIIPMLVLGKRNSSSFVWTNFENSGGWNNNVVSFCLGFLGPSTAMAGADGCVHMAEEVKRANLHVPRAIVGSLLINGFLGFAFVVVALYSITDIDAALTTPTGYPIIEIFRQATGSVAAAVVMECFIIMISFAATVAQLASTSRLTWAFARDKGLPYSEFFAKIHPTLKIPVRTVLLNFIITVLISTMVIGSTAALFAFTSLAIIALYISYAIPIASFLYQRLRKVTPTASTNNVPLVYGPWKLGRLGALFNVLALGFCVFLAVFLPFPTILPVNAQNMNYAGPILLAIGVLAIVDWFVRGRKVFVAPVVDVVGLGAE